jgi:hypothetical protein
MASTSAPLAPAEFAGESEIKRRLRGYFAKYPLKAFTKRQLTEHFNDVTEFNLQYHLGGLKSQGVIVSEKRGFYQFNPKWKSMQEKRDAVAVHSEESPRIVQNGTPFVPTQAPLTVVESPSAFTELARLWASGFEERLRLVPERFTEADLTFFARMRDRAFPAK